MKTRIAGLAFLSIIAALGTGCLTVEREHWQCGTSCVMTGGEVKNNTDSFYRGVKVTVTYYDETGRTFSAAAQTCTDIINPHDSSPFEITENSYIAAFKITGYQLAFEGEPATDVLPNYLTVSDIAFESWGPYGFRMEATIQNSGAVIYDYITVCTAFYREGVLTHLDPPYFPLGTLEPGESTRYEANVFYSAFVPTEVRVWVKGVQRDAYGWVMPVSTGLIPIPDLIPWH